MVNEWRLIALICAAAGMLASVCFADTPAVPAGKTVKVSLEARGIPLKTAVKTIFEGTGLTYRIQPGVGDVVVEIRLKGVTLDQALNAIADAVGLSVSLDNGVYVIGVPTRVSLGRTPKRQAPAAAEQLAPPDSAARESTDQAQPTPADSSAAAGYGPPYYNQPGGYPYGYGAPSPNLQLGGVTILGAGPAYYGQPGGYPYGYGAPSSNLQFGGLTILGGGSSCTASPARIRTVQTSSWGTSRYSEVMRRLCRGLPSLCCHIRRKPAEPEPNLISARADLQSPKQPLELTRSLGHRRCPDCSLRGYLP